MTKKKCVLILLLFITILSTTLISAGTYNVNFRLDEKSHKVAVKVINANTNEKIGIPIFTKTDPFGKANISFTATTEIRLSILVMKGSAIINTIPVGPFSQPGTIDLDLRENPTPIPTNPETTESNKSIPNTTSETNTTNNITNTTIETNTTTEIENSTTNTTTLLSKITGFFTKKSETGSNQINTIWYYIIGAIIIVGIIGFFGTTHIKKKRDEKPVKVTTLDNFTENKTLLDNNKTEQPQESSKQTKLEEAEKKLAEAEADIKQVMSEIQELKSKDS